MLGIDVGRLHHVGHAAHPRDELHDLLQRTQLLHLGHLVAEVFEREPPLPQFFLLFRQLLGVEALLRLLEQREHVAHAEDSAGHAVGMKQLELVELFAHPDELDGNPGDPLDRQGRATAGVAVELCQDHAVQFERFVKRLGRVDRVLPGHRVTDQQHLVGADRAIDLPEFFHQRFVDVQPAGGVENDDVNLPRLAGLGDTILADLDRVRRDPLGVDRHPQLLADDRELLDRGGALQVGGDQHGTPPLGLDEAGQLAAGCGLATPLQAAHHQDRDFALLETNRVIHRAHERDEFSVDDTDKLLERLQGFQDLGPDGGAAHTVAE